MTFVTMSLKRWQSAALVAAAVLTFQAAGVLADAAGAKPNPSIKEVMKEAYKGKESLQAKVLSGTATAEQRARFLELTDALVGAEPPKGEKASWDGKVAALVKASHALLDGAGGDAAAQAAFKTASDCKGCHTPHKGK